MKIFFIQQIVFENVCKMAVIFFILCCDFWLAECDSCVHLLLDDVDMLDQNITEVSEDLDSVSVGVGAMRRLDRIEEEVATLRVRRVDNQGPV